jgi:hypothetical protein
VGSSDNKLQSKQMFAENLNRNIYTNKFVLTKDFLKSIKQQLHLRAALLRQHTTPKSAGCRDKRDTYEFWRKIHQKSIKK